VRPAAIRAADVVAHALGRAPTLGSGRLVCIDGPAGSGKTTLAADVAELAGAPVVHLDDLYPGWDGLFTVDPEVLGLLRPLAEDRPGRYRRWDWYADEYCETRQVEPAALLVLEGVGAGNRAWADLVTTLVWVEAPPETRRARALERDGDGLLEHWADWTRDEQRLFHDQQTRARADLVVETGDA
jgi:uridine kinase